MVAVVGAALVGLAWYLGRDRLGSAPQVVLIHNADQLPANLAALIDEHVAEVRRAPRSADAHGELGLVYEANGLWSEAIQCYAIVERLRPNEPVWPYHRAIAMREAGDVEGALALLDRLAREHFDFAALQLRYGESLLGAGDLGGAAGAFRRVTALAPESALGYVGLGDVLLRRREYDQARKLLEKAVAMDPTYKAAHYSLGLAYRGLGQDEAAQKELGEGLDAKRRVMPDSLTLRLRDKTSANVSEQLKAASRHRAQGRLDQAAEVLEALVERLPDSTAALNNLAMVYLDQQRAAEAMELLLRAERLGDTLFATYLNQAACCLALNRKADALSYAQQAVQASPNDGRGYLATANVLIRSGRYGQARHVLAKAEELLPRHPQLAVLKNNLAAHENR
ncbi:MAG: tetratricopeptide repeat protein [Planctomycetes bacterium]|nr:tetratricopeptide repeat protein [Planctomycetota bacterium]